MEPANRTRRWIEFVALVVGVPSSIITIALGAGAEGWWTPIVRHWRTFWCLAVLGLLAALAIVAITWVAQPQNGRWPIAIRRLGVMAVVAAWSATLPIPSVLGSFLIASTFSTVLLLAWCASWVTARKRTLRETTREAFRHGLERWGEKLNPVYRFGMDAIKGPRPHRQPSRLNPGRASAAGAILILVVWLGLAVAGALTIHVTVETVSPADRDGLQTLPAEPNPSNTQPPASVPAERISSTTTTSAVGSLHCNYRAGEGPDLPPPVEAAVAKAVSEAKKRFLVCPTERMTWQQSTEVYQQSVFTYDGEGAVLVVWRSRGEWIATFVSSDDAAAYRLVSPSLNWSVLGKPLPFIRCDGLWVQPFVGRDDRLVGIGVRSREDEERRADQPLYVWGSAVEVLIGHAPHLLRLPHGGPSTDIVGPVQHFASGQIVRAPHEAAVALTGEALIFHCT